MSTTSMRLSGVDTLVIDDDQFGIDLLNHMLRGFGMDRVKIVKTANEGRALLENHVYDLVICGAILPDSSGADLVKWIRRLKPPGRFVPILVLTAYSQLNTVKAIRDAGAHMVIKKPASPRVLFDRIEWAARPARPFVETSVYVGPDRRFKFVGPPDGVGRRDTDLPAEIGDAVEPNLSQDEIDAMIRPTKVFAE